MTDEPLPPANPSEFPPELREALRRMSLRGPVVDQATGAVVAEDGRMVDEPDPITEFLGPEYARIARARRLLEDACAVVVDTAQRVKDFRPIGTDELPAAVAALASSEYVDEDESGARWVSRACTSTPVKLSGIGAEAVAFIGAVTLLRAALAELDEARAVAGPPEGNHP